MRSFGQSEIQLDSTLVGIVRVQDLTAASSVCPRIQIRIGVDLQRTPSHGDASGRPYRITDWRGELRLAESSETLTTVELVGARRATRFPEDQHEVQLTLVGELDARRIEAIERKRDGQPPIFWLELWPQVQSADPGVFCQVHTIRVAPPRETWLAFLEASSSVAYEVLEVRFDAADREHIASGLRHLRDARAKLLLGEYVDAVAACRKAIDAATKDAGPGPIEDYWGAFFSARLDKRRGKEFGGLLARVKGLGNLAHHDNGIGFEFSRAEAQCAIRVTEACFALIAQLSGKTSRADV